MKVTIKDIAEYCDVSVGTVDRALNNRPGISKETKQKILSAIKEKNYHINHIGRSLAKGKTLTIGVVCFDLYNNFFPELIDKIEYEAKKKGYYIHLILTHKDLQMEIDGLNYLNERQVDGIILFPIGVGHKYTDFLKNLGIPIVTVFNRVDDSIPFVGIDGYAAMKEAVEYIADKGYEQIYYITPQITKQKEDGLNVYLLEERARGYREGILEIGMKSPLVLEKGSIEEKVNQIIGNDRLDGKTVLLCLCDSYALAVMKYLKSIKIKIPNQIGLMGFDRIEELEYVEPRLATISYSVKEIGEKAIKTLFDIINDNEYEDKVILDYQIVQGESLK